MYLCLIRALQISSFFIFDICLNFKVRKHWTTFLMNEFRCDRVSLQSKAWQFSSERKFWFLMSRKWMTLTKIWWKISFCEKTLCLLWKSVTITSVEMYIPPPQCLLKGLWHRIFEHVFAWFHSWKCPFKTQFRWIVPLTLNLILMKMSL